MEPKAKELRDKAEESQREYERAKTQLDRYEASCSHEFSETVYDPVYHPAYTCPGDPPGTMGVDWRGPVHVPAETEDRWRRECNRCGLVEHTTLAKEEVKVKKIPRWRN